MKTTIRLVGKITNSLDDISVVAIPEASTWALTAIGFAASGMLGVRRASLAPA
jgi:hypothetical protein